MPLIMVSKCNSLRGNSFWQETVRMTTVLDSNLELMMLGFNLLIWMWKDRLKKDTNMVCKETILLLYKYSVVTRKEISLRSQNLEPFLIKTFPTNKELCLDILIKPSTLKERELTRIFSYTPWQEKLSIPNRLNMVVSLHIIWTAHQVNVVDHFWPRMEYCWECILMLKTIWMMTSTWSTSSLTPLSIGTTKNSSCMSMNQKMWSQWSL